MNGKITISRYNDFRNKEPIHITITDEKSGVTFCDIEMSLESFSRAITGLSLQECNISIHNIDRIGMKREMKKEFIKISKGSFGLSDNEKEELLKPYNIDGWIGSKYDIGNHHNFSHKNDAYKVGFTRWVVDDESLEGDE